MAFTDWLHRMWEEQRPNLVWCVLGLMAAMLIGIGAALTKGLTGWQQFGIIAILAFFLIWAVIATIRAAQVPSRATTVNNVEQLINEWILKFRIKNQRLDDTNCHFSYEVTLPDTVLRSVLMRPTGVLANYLQFYCPINITDDQLAQLTKLGNQGKSLFLQEYLAECAKARANVRVTESKDDQRLHMRIDKIFPITAYLNESDFLTALGALQQDLAIAITHIDVCISRVRNNIGSATQPLLLTPSTEASPH